MLLGSLRCGVFKVDLTCKHCGYDRGELVEAQRRYGSGRIASVMCPDCAAAIQDQDPSRPIRNPALWERID